MTTCSVEWDPTKLIVEAITSKDAQNFQSVLAQLSNEMKKHNYDKIRLITKAALILKNKI